MYLIKQTPPFSILHRKDMKNAKHFISLNGIHILYTEDDTLKWGWLKHISISHRNKYPSWDEILDAKNQLLGDIDCMMVMPKEKDYVNIHPNTFHIWECPESWGLQ